MHASQFCFMSGVWRGPEPCTPVRSRALPRPLLHPPAFTAVSLKHFQSGGNSRSTAALRCQKVEHCRGVRVELPRAHW